MKVPEKYIPKNLSNRDKKTQADMLKQSRNMYKNNIYIVRKPVKSFNSKPSNHVKKAKNYIM